MDQGNSRFVPYLQRIAGVKTRLLEIPEALYAARLTLADADRALGDIRKRLNDAKGGAKDSENEIALDVASATLPVPESAKAGALPALAFTNEAGRKAETQRRARNNPAYRAFTKAVDGIEAELWQADHARTLQELAVKRLEDEQRALQTYSDCTVAETMLLTAGR